MFPYILSGLSPNFIFLAEKLYLAYLPVFQQLSLIPTSLGLNFFCFFRWVFESSLPLQPQSDKLMPEAERLAEAATDFERKDKK